MAAVHSANERLNRNSKISNQNHIIEKTGEDGKIQYNCTACRKVFNSRSQRYYHINCNQLQILAFKCDHCDKSFARRTQWKYHNESHISPINKCHKCQKTFSNPLALKKHLTVHKVEPQICPHCDKTFKKKISLEQHIAAQHLNQLQYGCAHCSKKYASKSTLQLHLQTHEKKRFECSFCGKLFQRNSTLNLHLKRHNNTNSYKCTVCQKNYSESGALARHRKIHEVSVLQYYCILCDKSILRKDNMKRHLTTIHPAEKFENIVKVIKPSTKLQKEQKTVKNEFCNLYNATQDNLIIENKLICEPFEMESIKIHQKNAIPEKYHMTNHINVITAITKDKLTRMNDNKSLKKDQNSNHHQQGDLVLENQEASYKDSIQVENKAFVRDDIVAEHILLIDHVKPRLSLNHTEEQKLQQTLGNNQEYIEPQNDALKTSDTCVVNHQKPTENETALIPTFSSVIRSVGNVKKKLTTNFVTANKSLSQTSLEYRHKKYCHYNYNIDLYRKILGCNEEDDVENVDKQRTCDHMAKSSNPVHWRKSFKNSYETSGS